MPLPFGNGNTESADVSIPALFPDSLQDCCLRRVLDHLVRCGRAVERAARRDVADRREDEERAAAARTDSTAAAVAARSLTQRRRSSLLSEVSSCFGRSASFEVDSGVGDDAPGFFAESRIFLSGAATCRTHLTLFLSAQLQDLLMRQARERPLSEPGTLFTFATLCSERLATLVACCGDGKRDESGPADDHGDEEASEMECTSNWDRFLCSSLGGEVLLSCLVQTSGLSTLVLQRVCSNEVLRVVSDTCIRLQTLDISHSRRVSDLGLMQLCGGGGAFAADGVFQRPGRGCKFLRELRFNPQGDGSEPVMPRVVACLLRSLPLMEVADLHYLHQGIHHYFRGGEGGSSYRRRPDRVAPLNLIHYTGSDKLAEVLQICPKLRNFKLFVTDALPSLGATLKSLNHSLNNVTLVYTEQDRLLGLQEFLSACGGQISNLEIDCPAGTVTTLSDLSAVASHCRFLESLSFCNLTLPESLSVEDFPDPMRPLALPFLSSFRASCVCLSSPRPVGRPFFRFLLGGCPDIERLTLSFPEPAFFFSDFLLDEVMSANPLCRLERFAVRRVSLTLISALRLISSRPKLRAIGRLLEWDVQNGELNNFVQILRRANSLKLLQDISIF